MATSSKVMFKLDELRKRAADSLNERIADAELEIASYDDDEALSERIHQWRARQEERVAELYQKLTQPEARLSDHQLAKWSIEKIPEVDRYERENARRRLARLVSTRSRMEAKAHSLVADADGNISLTKTQLDEFFGL